MRLLIIRHGDPDYVRDSLTEKGRREAELSPTAMNLRCSCALRHFFACK